MMQPGATFLNELSDCGLAVGSFQQFDAGIACRQHGYVHMFGFWDGYTSELDRAENNLAKYIILIGLVVAGWFLYLAYVAYRVDIRRRLIWTSAVYGVVVALTLALDLYFQSHLRDSTGG